MKWRITQILLSTTLLVFILLKIDFQKITQTFQNINISLFLMALIVSIVAILINTKKWQILLSVNNIFIPYYSLLKQNFLSIFYSIALVGQLSGELIKAYRITRGQQNKMKIISSIIGDKITGVMALFVVIIIIAPIFLNSNASLAYFFVFISIVGVLIITVSLFIPAVFIKTFIHNLKLNKFKKINFHFFEVFEFYQTYRKGRSFYYILIISLLYQLLATVAFAFISESVNIHLSFAQYLWVFSLLSLLIFIPLSIAGLGIREGSLVFLLGLLNVPAEQALSASLLLFVITVIMGGVGAIFELTQK